MLDTAELQARVLDPGTSATDLLHWSRFLFVS